MIKKIIFAVIIIFVVVMAADIGMVYYGLSKIAKKTNTTPEYFPRLFAKVLQQPTLSPGFNFVVLGLDPRNDTLEKTEVTDTIMIARLTPNWKVNLVSIPRDLWVYSLKSKVNQIYPQSFKTKDSFAYIQDQFSELVGQKIVKTVVITTSSLIKLTNLVGGVDVNLETGFIDNQYPNPAYVASPSPKIPVYITIEFKKGPVHLDSSNITEFVRSRHSLTDGTDIGRIQRQQLLLDALLAKIKTPEFYKNVNNLFALYNFFHQDLQTNFTDEDILSLALTGQQQIQNLSLNKTTIPSGDNPKTDIIYHPTSTEFGQWVFIPQDKQYQSFKKYISDSLSL